MSESLGLPSMATVPVYLEIGEKRVFASALEWPGWTRSARDEQRALETLAAYAPRYAAVPRAARIAFAIDAQPSFKVVERVKGNATTDFGAPGIHASSDTKSLMPSEAERICALLAASWKVFDAAVAKAPAELRKGPRGGGRDRDKIADHIIDAESAYTPKLGLKLETPGRDDKAAVQATRKAILDAIRASAGGPQTGEKRWPPRYVARRMAWHLLDHTWEIEDRSL
jgi:plasmid stabilization system protein ParE